MVPILLIFRCQLETIPLLCFCSEKQLDFVLPLTYELWPNFYYDVLCGVLYFIYFIFDFDFMDLVFNILWLPAFFIPFKNVALTTI